MRTAKAIGLVFMILMGVLITLSFYSVSLLIRPLTPETSLPRNHKLGRIEPAEL